VPLAPEYAIGIDSIFSKIRRDNRECMFVSGVNDTGDKREKFSGIFFSFFVKSLVECTLHLKMEFLLSLTLPKNISAMSLTLAIILGFLVIYDQTPGEKCYRRCCCHRR
jgi:hypothetical protein